MRVCPFPFTAKHRLVGVLDSLPAGHWTGRDGTGQDGTGREHTNTLKQVMFRICLEDANSTEKRWAVVKHKIETASPIQLNDQEAPSPTHVAQQQLMKIHLITTLVLPLY